MNDQLTLLIQLQDIDARIRTHRTEKGRLPEQIAQLEAKSEASAAELGKARETLEAAQKARRDRDRDLEEGGRKVEKLKSRTTEIKTNKEYQALLKEIETAEQESKAIEDDILKLMEKIDAATKEIKAVEERAAQESVSINEERKQLEAGMAAADEALAAEERSRNELAARVEQPVLTKYELLLGSKNGRAIAEARGEACGGCYMSIPPQLFVNVKKNESIITCPHCHRILYYKEVIAPKSA